MRGFCHGLSLVARALRLEGACAIAMEDPCAEQHRAVAASASLSLRPLPVDSRGARTDLLDATRRRRRALAGAPVPDRRRAASRPARGGVTWATATGGLIVEDDYDGEFRYDRQPVGALQALAPDHVVYGGTASKTIAPGLRLAWIVVPPRLLDTVVSLRSAEDVHVSALEQVALCEMLRSGGYERHVRRMRARYRARRDRVLDLLAQRAPALVPVGISAGIGMLLELPEDGPDSSHLVEAALRRSIELYPLASSYHEGRGPQRRHRARLRRSGAARFRGRPERARGGALGAVPGLTRAACNDR